MTLLRDVPLRSVPTTAPETALDEALRLMNDEPLKTVVLVGDGTYLGVFDAGAAESGGVPRDVDPATLAVGPYAYTPRVVGRPGTVVDAALLAALRRAGQDVLPVVRNNTFLGVVTREDVEGVPAEGVEPGQ